MTTTENLTFLFSDIEHSTRLAQAFREEYPELLQKHRAIIRRRVAEQEGHEIDSAGDGFFFIFQLPEQAVLAASMIQKDFASKSWAKAAGLQVRIGIHTGTALKTGSGYTGVEVHRASRICNAAHGGQVLLSRATHELLGDRFTPELSLSDLGSYLLKDFDSPARLFQLNIAGTLQQFPKPRIDPVNKRVAVLPFLNLSNDPDQVFFGEGIAEDIIIALGEIRGLSVVSRSSVAALRGEMLNARQFGNRLDTIAVLEGTVRKNKGLLRISAELVDTDSGLNLWSARYDVEREDIFHVQDQIARRIAEALECELIPEQYRSIQQRQTSNIEAYDFYLRGRRLYSQYSQRGVELALQMFEKAIEADDTYALAYAGIADCYSYQYQHVARADEFLGKADQASLKAIAHAPSLAEVYVSRGIALTLQHKFEAAESSFQFAIEHNPSLFLGWYHYARMCFTLGQLDKAARLFEEANRVQPDDYQSILLAGQVYDDLACEELSEKARRKGVEIVGQRLELNPGDTRALYLGANGLVSLGEKEKGLVWLRRALVLEPDDSMLLYNAGCIYALLNMKSEALTCLERAFDRGLTLRGWYENDSNLECLRDHPRFQALMQKL